MLRPIDRKGESVARSVLLSSVSCVCECGVGILLVLLLLYTAICWRVTGTGTLVATYGYVRV